MATSGRLPVIIVALIGVLLALIGANLLGLRLASTAYSFDVGFRADRHFLAGFFQQEEDANGARYRWTRAESSIVVEPFVMAPRPAVTLSIGGIPHIAESPRLVYASVDGEPLTTLAIQREPRHYTLLLPSETLVDGRLHLTLLSATSQVPPDPRAVGVRLDAVEMRWPPDAWALPTWELLLTQWGIVVAALAGGWRLRLSRGALAATVAVLVVLLAWMTSADLLVAAAWQFRLLIAAVAVLVFVLGAFPYLARLLPAHAHNPAGARAELRWLLLLTVLALTVRLVAALWPTFDSHDWYIHEDRLRDFQYGSILLFDKPAEFSNQVAIVPPAFYVLVAPFTLFTIDTVPTTHGVFTFLDGCALLLLGIFVRQIGGSARAARLALLLLALLPIQFTALWWGFGPQVIGQALFLALVVFVAHYNLATRLWWVVAAVTFSVIILVHNGVALLGGFWLAAYVGLVWLFQRQEKQHWLGWGLIAAASAVIALIMLYSDVVALQFQGVADNDRLAFTENDIFRVKWTLGSLCTSFFPLGVSCDQFVYAPGAANILPQVGVTLLGLLLPLAGLVFVLLRVSGLARWLVLAWLGSAGLFFAVDLVSGLQVRYAYFVVPLVCGGLGMLLDRLAARHRLGWLLPLCIVGIVALAGLTLWKSNLREANLSGATLNDTTLRSVDLQGATLRGTTLRRADLREADLRGADLREAVLQQALLREAMLSDTTLLQGADLRGADLSKTDLSTLDLSGCDLSDANLGRAILTGTSLSGANLTGANLSRASLGQTDLRGADLRHVVLVDADLYGARYNHETQWPAGLVPAFAGAVCEAE